MIAHRSGRAGADDRRNELMLTLAGTLAVLFAVFLLAWYRTVVSLPAARRPAFTGVPLFKWGVPAASALAFGAGLLAAGSRSGWTALVLSAAGAALATLLIGFDRYSAQMRDVYARYRSFKAERPHVGEAEALFRTARWRYPDWSEDRLAELISGKDIENLLLLMIIQENRINPISDWDLYRTLRAKAAAISGRRRNG